MSLYLKTTFRKMRRWWWWWWDECGDKVVVCVWVKGGGAVKGFGEVSNYRLQTNRHARKDKTLKRLINSMNNIFHFIYNI